MGMVIRINLFAWIVDSLVQLVCSFVEDILESDTGLKCVAGKLMALFVGPTTMERLRSMLGKRVVEGENPRQLFCLPVYLRRDGVVFRVGGIVQILDPTKNDDLRFCIKDILISYDLEQVFACLVPVSMDQSLNQAHRVLLGEEMMVDLNVLVSTRDHGMSKILVSEGMNKIMYGIPTYPIQIQRAVRKHQLCSSLRKDVQRFLSGFSIAQSWSLGTVDWRLDPGIFGLEKETDFTMDFHIEKFSMSIAHIDLLLGDGWDVKPFAGNSGYRAVITLELSIDTNHQELKLKAHAVICSGELSQKNHRLQTLKSLHSSDYNLDPSGLKSTENTLTRPENSFALLGTGRSLTWEEFRNIEECNISSAEGSPQGGTQYMTMSLDSSLFQPNASAAANALQELLRKANFNSQNFYYYSPLGKQQRLKDEHSVSSKRPSTSTPADEMENSRKEHESRGSTSSVFQDYSRDQLDTIEADTCCSEDLAANAFSSFETIKHGSSDQPSVLINQRIHNSRPSSRLSLCPETNQIEKELFPRSKSESESSDEYVKLSKMATDNPVTRIQTIRHSNDLDADETNDHSELNLSSASLPDQHTLRPGSTESTPAQPHRKAFFPRSLDSLLDSSIELNLSRENNSQESGERNSDVSPVCILPENSDSLRLKVVEYINSLPSESNNSKLPSSFSPSRVDFRLSVTSPDSVIKTRVREDGNVSVCSSRSRASRGSDLGSLSGRFGQGISGNFYGGGVPSEHHCPFPEEWQYNTIPEVIENDDEID